MDIPNYVIIGYLILFSTNIAVTVNVTCSAGYYLNVTSVSCEKCERGLYQDAADHQLPNCTSCPVHPDTGQQADTLSTASNSISFCFFEPLIRDFWPQYGPISGGTDVRVSLAAFDEDYYPTYAYIAREDADITGYNSSEKSVNMLSRRVNSTRNDTIQITWSIDRMYSSVQEYRYVEDPVVESVDQLKTFISGGLDLAVRGRYLHHVQLPELFITMVYRGVPESVYSPCQHVEDSNGTEITCQTPNLNALLERYNIQLGRRKRSGEPQSFNDEDKQFYGGVKLDGVEEFKNLSSALEGTGQFLVYLDPEYYPFGEENFVKRFDPKDTFLNIEGKRLNYASDEDDVKVRIGQDDCNVTFLASNMLTCIPPPTQPKVDPLGYGPNKTPRVTVFVGNLVFIIGFLEYMTPSSKASTENEVLYGIIGGSAAIALLLLIITIVMVILCRRKQRKNESKSEFETTLGQHRGSRVQPGRYISNDRAPVNGNPDATYTDVLDGTYRPTLENSHSQRGRQMSETITPPHSPNGLSPSSPDFYMSDINGTPKLYPRFLAGNSMPDGNDASDNIIEELEENLRISVKECLIPAEYLTVGDIIGTGYFGKVFRGILQEKGPDKDMEEVVAVKTIQGTLHTVKEVGAFLEEAVIMKDFDHTNVLNLIGVSMRGTQPLVILPFMANGDLKTYIKEPSRSMKVKELLAFGKQIASGMAYLAKQKFVHRDLATRNCMLSDTHVVKIADFGLSRDIYKSDYYRVEDRHRPLPVRWMAVESLTNGIFSTKSDVWSFGVCLWELLTRGCSPYPDVDTFNIKQYVCSGRRLSQPDHTPDDVYAVLESCWHEEPERRPDFTELYDTIDNILETNDPNYTRIIFVS